MNRYTLDWDWDQKAPIFDVDALCFDEYAVGFNKDPEGMWVKYEDYQKEILKVIENAKN